MKSLELRPNEENLLDMFLKDSIGRNEGLYYFINLLNSAENNVSIAIDAKWGSGKTFFVKQAKLILDAYSNLNKNKANDEQIKNKFESYKGKKEDFKIKNIIPLDKLRNTMYKSLKLYINTKNLSKDFIKELKNIIKGNEGKTLLSVVIDGNSQQEYMSMYKINVSDRFLQLISKYGKYELLR